MKSDHNPKDTAESSNGYRLVNCSNGDDYMTSAIAFESDVQFFNPPFLKGWRAALAKIASAYAGNVLRKSAENIHQTALKLIGVRHLIANESYGSNLFDPTEKYISALQKSLEDTQIFNDQINSKNIKSQKLKDDLLYFRNHFLLYEAVAQKLISDIRQHDSKVKYSQSNSNSNPYAKNSSFNDFLEKRLAEASNNPKIGLDIMESCGIINKAGEITRDFGGQS